jgi:heterotetrameric sarcosine oxidase gamma subunit
MTDSERLAPYAGARDYDIVGRTSTLSTRWRARNSGGNGCSFRAGVPFGCAAGDAHGTLVVGSGPGEWLLLSAPGTGAAVREHVKQIQEEEFVSVFDATHGLALVRITGARAPDLLAKVCAIDFSEAVTPNGAAFRSFVAKLVTDVIRDDLDGERSYLLHCERSSGQYLFDALIDAGNEYDIEVDGFVDPGNRGEERA